MYNVHKFQALSHTVSTEPEIGRLSLPVSELPIAPDHLRLPDAYETSSRRIPDTSMNADKLV